MQQAKNPLEKSFPDISSTITSSQPPMQDQSELKATKVSVPKKPLNQSESKLIHLFNLAHSKIDSPFSKLYSLLYHKQEEQQTQTLPDPILKKFCLNCGGLLIPGLTVSIRVVYTKQKIRKLRTRCLACRHSIFDDGLIQKQEKVEPVVKPVVVQSTKEDNNHNITNLKSKERRKKRKMNNLSNLLQDKKKKKTEESKLNSLNLMEFLK